MHFSVRTVFQSERVVNIFNYGHFRDENTILHLMYAEQIWSDNKYEHYIFLQCLKMIFAISIHSAWRIHSTGDIYTKVQN